jgi:hypothetical protein
VEGGARVERDEGVDGDEGVFHMFHMFRDIRCPPAHDDGVYLVSPSLAGQSSIEGTRIIKQGTISERPFI